MEYVNFVTVLSALIIAIGAYFIGRLVQYLKDKKNADKRETDKFNRSVRVRAGQAAEQIAPLLDDFPYNPGDCRFIGKPVDYIVFHGATNKEITDVIFLEVKSGKSQLSQQEKTLKEVIEQGNVHWDQYNVRTG